MSKLLCLAFVLSLTACQTPPPPVEAPADVVKAQDIENPEDLDCSTLSAHIAASCCKGQDEPCLKCQTKQRVYTKVYREKCKTPPPEAKIVVGKDPFSNLAEADCDQLKDASRRMCCQAMIDSCKTCADKVAEAQQRFRSKKCK